MRRLTRLTSWVAVTGCVAGLSLLPSASAEAQDTGDRPGLREASYMGAGPIMTLPRQVPGIKAFRLFPSLGFGLYVEGRMSLSPPSEEPHFDPDRTPEDALPSDVPYDDEAEYRTLGGGVVWPFSSGVAVYGGLGYASRTPYREYFRAGGGPGEEYYWVEDRTRAESRVNASAGALVQVGRHVLIRAGADYFPNGGSLGLILALP